MLAEALSCVRLGLIVRFESKDERNQTAENEKLVGKAKS